MKNPVLLPIEQLEPDMEVMGDIQDGQGRRLVAGGTLLSPSLIQVLGRRGITHVQVGVEVKLDDAELMARRTEIEQRLAHLFRHQTEDPLMQRLRESLLAYRLEHLS